MRKLFFIAFIIVLVASCNKDDPSPQARGYLRLNLKVNLMIRETGGRLMAVDTDQFKVTIFTSSHAEVVVYENATDLPAMIELPVGQYYATASSDDLVPAGFDAPFYAGQSEVFDIDKEQTKQVTIGCSLANCMLTIDYSDFVKSNFTDWHTEVSVAAGSLMFTQGETRTGYFELTPIHIASTLEYAGGTVIKTATGDIPEPKAKTYYRIVVDASLNDGQAGFDLWVDENVDTVDIAFNGGTVNPPSGVETISIDQVVYGGLIITEIMPDPVALSDTEGEWIEIFNTTGQRINLNGLRLSDNTSTIPIDTDVYLNPGGYLTIAKAAALQNPGFVTTTLSLTNSGETLKLIAPSGLEIAVVDFTTIIDELAEKSGASLNLCRDHFTADEAQQPGNWCVATTAYSTGDLGTPGTANIVCQ